MNLEFFMGIAAGMACCGFWMIIFRDKKQKRDKKGRFVSKNQRIDQWHAYKSLKDEYYERQRQSLNVIHTRFAGDDPVYKELVRKLDGDKS